MANNSEFVAFLLDQLQLLGPVSGRRMFGGHGVFIDGLMFALVVDDTLYFKIDDTSRPLYEANGLAPFTYQRGQKTVALSYYQAPEEALDDREVLLEWANRAVSAALLRAHA